jgi:chromosome partitioning protein
VARKVLAVANQKGGVGKTTTALNLAAALTLAGKNTLVVDLDPHACASVHLRFYPENLTYTVYDLFHSPAGELGKVWKMAKQTGEELPFDFVAGHIRIAELENDLKDRPDKGAILGRCLEPVLEEYDHVLLDCPPHIGIVLVNALVASDLLIIPIQTDFLALHGVRLLFDTVRTLNRVLPEPIQFRALATMFDRRASACNRVLGLLRKKLGSRMFETVVHMDTKFREASAQGQVIYDIYPKCRGALEYQQLAKEILAL